MVHGGTNHRQIPRAVVRKSGILRIHVQFLPSAQDVGTPVLTSGQLSVTYTYALALAGDEKSPGARMLT